MSPVHQTARKTGSAQDVEPYSGITLRMPGKAFLQLLVAVTLDAFSCRGMGAFSYRLLSRQPERQALRRMLSRIPG